MFIMDVPHIPAQQTPIVLAQAAPQGTGAPLQQPDFIFKDCQETESTGDPRSALRGVDPAGLLANYIQNRDNREVYLPAIKTTLLEGTAHGNITTEVDNTGRTSYGYDPVPNYVGKDRAVFMAEFEGKRYKIAIELHVFNYAPPGEFGTSTCPEPQLIKATKLSSGASSSDAGYYLSSISVIFTDFAGTAVGQANASGIALDTTPSATTGSPLGDNNR